MARKPWIASARVILTAALAVGVSACGAVNLDKAGNPVPRPVVLTLAEGDDNFLAAQPFARAVQQLSRGSMQIKIESPWRPKDPYYQSNLVKDVQADKAQLGITVVPAFGVIGIDSFQALQAPFLIDSYTLERKVLASAIPRKMLAGLQTEGLVGLGILPGPLIRPLSYSRPLLAAASYSGVRIGIIPSVVTADLFRALRATVVVRQRGGVVSAGEDITGLGGLTADTIGIGAGLYTPRAILTGNVILWPNFYVVFVNRGTFDVLTPGQRNLLARAATVASASLVWEQNDAASMRDLCQRRIKVVSASKADQAGLSAAARPVYRLLESSASTRAFIDDITAMRQATSSTPDAVTCLADQAAAPSRGGAAQLDGTWQVTFTEGQLAAAGAGSGELLPGEGNWGHFILKFREGHWWWLGPSASASASGTFVVTGRLIVFHRHDTAYAGSNTEVWGPYIWSVYRDTLTFKTDGWSGGVQGPTGMVVKPWQKTGR